MSASKKLLGSIAALIVALAMATTATYAWFTMSSTPTASMEFKVTSNDGLLVAVYTADEDGTVKAISEFKGSLTFADIIALYGSLDYTDTDDGTVLRDATTTDGLTFKDLGGETLGAAGYLEFRLAFRSTQEASVYLRESTTVGGETTDYNKVLAVSSGSLEKAKAWDGFDGDNYGFTAYSVDGTPVASAVTGDYINAHAANAVRVAFLDSTGTAGAAKTPTAAATIWDPNPDKGFTKNLWNDWDDETTPVETPPAGEKYNLAVDYWNKNSSTQITTLETTGKAALAAAKKLDDIAKGGDSQFKVVMTQEDGSGEVDYYYGYITVRIWVEGWDGDAFRSVLNDIISVELQFIGA